MIVTEESREFAMNLLATMVAEDRAKQEGKRFEEVFSELRRSKTFEELYDPETGLWLNGPDYISDEYDLELQRRNQRN